MTSSLTIDACGSRCRRSSHRASEPRHRRCAADHRRRRDRSTMTRVDFDDATIRKQRDAVESGERDVFAWTAIGKVRRGARSMPDGLRSRRDTSTAIFAVVTTRSLESCSCSRSRVSSSRLTRQFGAWHSGIAKHSTLSEHRRPLDRSDASSAQQDAVVGQRAAMLVDSTSAATKRVLERSRRAESCSRLRAS